MQVAIDGPAGSGKSTVCKIIAERYGFTYVDTGAMYRSIAWICEKFGYDNIEEKAKSVEFKLENNGTVVKIVYQGKEYDVTREIRTPEISSKVAGVAKNPEIRKILVEKQRQYGKNSDIVMEGRDITTVVLPDAEVKVYLTASDEERAKRRYKEWETRGEKTDFNSVLEEIRARDKMDMDRAESPLSCAEDAVFLDTTGLTLDEVADKIGGLIKSAGSK